MPSDAVATLEEALGKGEGGSDEDAEKLGVQGSGPFESIRLPIENSK